MFKEILEQAKEDLDSVFGEGYAQANPFLIDRLLQQSFKAKKVIQHSRYEANNFIANEALDTLFAEGFFDAMIDKDGFISTMAIVDVLAEKLNVPKDSAFILNASKLVCRKFGPSVQKGPANSRVRGVIMCS